MGIFKIGHTGDISMGGIWYNAVNNGDTIFSSELQQILSKNDYNVANLEGPVQDVPSDPKSSVINPLNSISYLKRYGFNVFNLANNHIFDCGMEGYTETVKKIRETGLKSFGAGYNLDEASQFLLLKENNITLALIGTAQTDTSSAGFDQPGIFSIRNFNLLKNRVAEAREKADWIIVHYHGGEEYTQYPSPAKRRLLTRIARIPGVSIVIGHHSHTIQGLERPDQKTIFYSLGNFIFDYYSHDYYDFTTKGLLVNLTFTKNSYSYTLVPVDISKKDRSIRVGSSDQLKKIASLSDFGKYKKMWQKDAYRVIYKRKTEPNIIKVPLRHLSLKDRLFRRDFYSRLVQILQNPNGRPVYLGALLYWLRKSFGGRI